MQQRHQLRSLVIRSLTQLAISRPKVVVAISMLTAIACVLFMLQAIEVRTNRTDLLNPGSKFQQDWLEYARRFDAADDVVIVVEGSTPAVTCQAIETIGQQLLKHPHLFRNVHYHFDSAALREKGLHFLSVEELQRIDELLGRVTPFASGDPRAMQSDAFRNLVIAAAIDRNEYQSPWPFASIVRGLSAQLPEYSLTQNRKLGLISLHLVKSDQEFAQGSEAIRKLRSLANEVKPAYPGVRIGVTGLPVIEYDEMSTSEHDMTMASLVTLCFVTVLFWAGFGDLRYPAFAVVALLIGIMWTCGYLTLILGHLNILSMSFGVILIGLGVDFAIHYVARYLSIREPHEDSATALLRTSLGVGPAIFAGGLTTAIAFFATGLTEFLGVAELGIIAGGGILLCVLATLLVLPALLRLDSREYLPLRRSSQGYWSTILRPLWQKPKQTAAWGLIITTLLGLGITRLRYDHNLLHLQAAGLESVAWERHLLMNTDRSVWYAVSIAKDREELESLREEFRKLDSVERVEDISELTPSTSPEKDALIESIASQLSGIAATPAIAPLDSSQLPKGMRQQLAAIDSTLGLLSDNALLRQINLARMLVITDLGDQLVQLRAVSSPDPPIVSDLPAAVRARFIGHQGEQLMRVYAQGNIWNPVALERFVTQVKSVDPSVTGQPLQNYYGSRQMKRSYVQAAVYSTCAVLLVLWWDLRNIKHVLLAATPTLLGLIQLFGVMGLLQIPLNPANIIVLPLIVGIGIDDGIHVVHDRQHTTGRYSLLPATTNGIVMTSLTSMIGFGSLMLSQHEGLRSLGRVVTLGIACCLFTSIIWLPCLLSLLPDRRRPKPDTMRQ